MNERLLNENEITKIVGWPSAFEYAKIIEIVTAQDLKTTAALIAWLEEPCDKHEYKGTYDQVNMDDKTKK